MCSCAKERRLAAAEAEPEAMIEVDGGLCCDKREEVAKGPRSSEPTDECLREWFKLRIEAALGRSAFSEFALASKMELRGSIEEDCSKDLRFAKGEWLEEEGTAVDGLGGAAAAAAAVIDVLRTLETSGKESSPAAE